MSDLERALRAMRRNMVFYGVMIALLSALLAVNVYRLVQTAGEHPAGATVIVCEKFSQKCVAVRER